MPQKQKQMFYFEKKYDTLRVIKRAIRQTLLYFPHCMKNLLQNLSRYYRSGNRWWMPLVAGLFYSIALPPFNHEFSPVFFLFPLFGFVILVPLAAIALQKPFKRALFHMFLYGFAAAFGQYYWLMYDNVEGLWLIVIVGLLLISAFIGLVYLFAGLLLRMTASRLPKAYIIVFPALWVAIDYCRTLGDIAFPWAFLGYSLTPLVPLAQLASITGVWGLTYLIVLGNMLIWQSIAKIHHGQAVRKQTGMIVAFTALMVVISIGGWFRINRYSAAKTGPDAKNITISLLQPNIDQFHWGRGSLDTAFDVTESLVVKAGHEKPDLIIMPESSLLCFVTRRSAYRERVQSWSRLAKSPLIFGSLDFEIPPSGSYYDNFVYNTAFFLDTGSADFKPYHKIWLVPFSEGMPFESKFPILSRINLGEADFQRGREQTVFAIGRLIKAAPFICYESNFPRFVLERFRRGANLMVNITNDGWFGKSSGPYHHAMMARMRALENGVYCARAANSGISMFVDPLGRRLAQTRLYTREILTRSIPFYSIKTFYTKHGDWFVALCGLIIAAGAAGALTKRNNSGQAL
jgi:apolipoprotein N-acyltransferase